MRFDAARAPRRARRTRATPPKRSPAPCVTISLPPKLPPATSNAYEGRFSITQTLLTVLRGLNPFKRCLTHIPPPGLPRFSSCSRRASQAGLLPRAWSLVGSGSGVRVRAGELGNRLSECISAVRSREVRGASVSPAEYRAYRGPALGWDPGSKCPNNGCWRQTGSPTDPWSP